MARAATTITAAMAQVRFLTILQQPLVHLPTLVVLACALATSTPASSARPPHPFQPHSGAEAEPVGAMPPEASAVGAPPVAVPPPPAPAARAPPVAGQPTQAPASPIAG